jgi:hypothetical protein
MIFCLQGLRLTVLTRLSTFLRPDHLSLDWMCGGIGGVIPLFFLYAFMVWIVTVLSFITLLYPSQVQKSPKTTCPCVPSLCALASYDGTGFVLILVQGGSNMTRTICV